MLKAWMRHFGAQHLPGHAQIELDFLKLAATLLKRDDFLLPSTTSTIHPWAHLLIWSAREAEHDFLQGLGWILRTLDLSGQRRQDQLFITSSPQM